MFSMKLFITFLVCLNLTGCLGMPEKVTPVNEFKVNRYLGKWYEIARLDHSFERGLDQVTAEYSVLNDGGISVVNRGYSDIEDKWQEAKGKAYFVDDRSIGYLKVSFFGPFYGSYVVFELDKESYQYAFVSGPDLAYLWLLSRTKTIRPSVIERFKRVAEEKGFDTRRLIIVNHE